MYEYIYILQNILLKNVLAHFRVFENPGTKTTGTLTVTEKLAQLVKYLLYKHEESSSDP